MAAHQKPLCGMYHMRRQEATAAGESSELHWARIIQQQKKSVSRPGSASTPRGVQRDPLSPSSFGSAPRASPSSFGSDPPRNARAGCMTPRGVCSGTPRGSISCGPSGRSMSKETTGGVRTGSTTPTGLCSGRTSPNDWSRQTTSSSCAEPGAVPLGVSLASMTLASKRPMNESTRSVCTVFSAPNSSLQEQISQRLPFLAGLDDDSDEEESMPRGRHPLRKLFEVQTWSHPQRRGEAAELPVMTAPQLPPMRNVEYDSDDDDSSSDAGSLGSLDDMSGLDTCSDAFHIAEEPKDFEFKINVGGCLPQQAAPQPPVAPPPVRRRPRPARIHHTIINLAAHVA